MILRPWERGPARIRFAVAANRPSYCARKGGKQQISPWIGPFIPSMYFLALFMFSQKNRLADSIIYVVDSDCFFGMSPCQDLYTELYSHPIS